MADKNAELLSFFQNQMGADKEDKPLYIPDTSFDVLADLKAGKFKDGAGESLGEKMPMFILDCKALWGVPPWDKGSEDSGVKVPPKPQMYGEVWMVPAGGELADSNMVCRLLKKASQFRMVAAAVDRCMAGGTHYRSQVWVPKFEQTSNEYGSYYKFKVSPRSPESVKEWGILGQIVELLKGDPDLQRLRDDSLGMVYLQDLTEQEKAQLFLSSQANIRPALPPLPTTVQPAAALPSAEPVTAYNSNQF